MPEGMTHTARRRPRGCHPAPAHYRLTVRGPQRRWAFTGFRLSLGLLDPQAKPLLQCVGVDALVVRLLGSRASEQHDSLRREGNQNSFLRPNRSHSCPENNAPTHAPAGAPRARNVPAAPLAQDQPTLPTPKSTSRAYQPPGFANTSEVRVCCRPTRGPTSRRMPSYTPRYSSRQAATPKHERTPRSQLRVAPHGRQWPAGGLERGVELQLEGIM